MKQRRQSVVLAGLLALACGLTACSAMRGSGSSGSDTYNGGSGGMSGGGTGSSGSSGTTSSGGSASLDGAAAGSGAGSGATGMAAPNWHPNATVVAIEVVPRAASGAEAGSSEASAMGSSGTAGSSGSSGETGAMGAMDHSATGDSVYRVTLRLDDGTTAVVTQESVPMFRSGDRVALAGGMIQR